jgi:hypothetical protein
MLWPGHSNFKLSQKVQKQFWMASHDKDALDLELDTNLASTLADIVKNQFDFKY